MNSFHESLRCGGAAGAVNLGTAMGFGQIAFAIVLLYLIVRR